MKVKVSRKAHFNAAHRLYLGQDWSLRKRHAVLDGAITLIFNGHNDELRS